MVKIQVILFLSVAISFVAAIPVPEDDNGQELLAGKDTRYYRFPYFWFGRPVNGDDDDLSGDGGQYYRPINRRPSTVSFLNAGAGWGR